LKESAFQGKVVQSSVVLLSHRKCQKSVTEVSQIIWMASNDNNNYFLMISQRQKVIFFIKINGNIISYIYWSMVNLINILCLHFSYKSALRSFFHLHVTREKMPKRLSYKKIKRKMLMKLTPRNFAIVPPFVNAHLLFLRMKGNRIMIVFGTN